LLLLLSFEIIYISALNKLGLILYHFPIKILTTKKVMDITNDIIEIHNENLGSLSKKSLVLIFL